MSGDEADPNALVFPADDLVITFRTQKSGARGRLVRLGSTLDTILTSHAMPEFASGALAEALSLAALFGSALPAEGGLNFQTRSNGAVSFLVADYEAPGRLRGYARYDAEAGGTAETRIDPAALLGDGHLAITIDQGPGTDRYQGVLALDGAPLATAAAAYFEQREALPTFIQLAVAKHFAHDRPASDAQWQWRAGGLMMQSMARPDEDQPADADEDWSRVRMLSETIEAHELLDPTLAPERLLLRLFHEEGVIVERILPLTAFCRCSRAKVYDVLRSFGAKELADMRDDNGKISVTCEFCASAYAFDLAEIGESPT